MRLLRLILCVLVATWPALLDAQVSPAPGVLLQDEGTDQGRARTLNCVGAGITCSVAGSIGTLNVSGGAGGGVNTLNTLSGDLTIAGTASEVLVNSALTTITLSTPQTISTSSSPTFGGMTLTQLGGGGTLCVHASNAGVLSTAAADCGTGGGTPTFIIPGTGISVNANIGSVTVTNVGVQYLTPAGPLSVSQNVGSVTLTNTGVAYLTASTGITVDQHVSSVTITNSGVQYITPGSGLTIDQHVGSVTLTNSNPSATFVIGGTGITVDRNIGSVTVTNAGVTTATGTASRVTVNAATGAVTWTTPQDTASSSDMTLHGLTLTSLSGFANSCLRVNSTGVINGTGSDCGSGGAGVSSLNALTGALSVASGTAINIVTSGGNTFTINSVGADFISAGTGISVNANVGSVTVTNTGVLSAIGTAHQVGVSGATGNVTFSTPQDIDTTSTPSFASVSATNAASGAGFASCTQVNALGTFSNWGASCTTVNAVKGGIFIATGTAVNLVTTSTLGGASITINNTGVSFISAGTGITVNQNVGSVTVTNGGVTTATGTASRVTVNASTGSVTWTTPQDTSSQSDVAFHNVTVSALRGASASCVQINATTGALENTGAPCGPFIASTSAVNQIAIFTSAGSIGGFPQITASVNSTNTTVILDGSALSDGPYIRLIDNTATSKWLRTLGGAFDILNNSRSASLFTIDDSGNVRIPSPGTFTISLLGGSAHSCLRADINGLVSGTGSDCGGAGSSPGAPDRSVQFNSSSTFTGDSSFRFEGTPSNIVTVASLSVTNTWNSASTVFHAAVASITNTNSSAESTLLDLRAGASGTTSEFTIRKDGRIKTYGAAAPTDGQVLIGSTANADFRPATLTGGTAGAGISITNGSNSATVGIANEVWAVQSASVSVTNSTSPTATNLAFTLGSSATEIWSLECTTSYSYTSNASQDFLYTWVLPTGASVTWAPGFQSTTGDFWGQYGAGTTPTPLNTGTATGGIFPSATTGVNNATGAFLRGWIFGGGTGGQAMMAFSQNTLTGSQTVTVNKGSYCIFRKIMT